MCRNRIPPVLELHSRIVPLSGKKTHEFNRFQYASSPTGHLPSSTCFVKMITLDMFGWLNYVPFPDTILHAFVRKKSLKFNL